MLLQETVQGLCDTPLYKFSPSANAWVMQPQLCRLAAYDRFISDRAFGQKKRVLTTPAGYPELGDGYYRVGAYSQGPVFMIESVNPDIDSHGPYLNTYMLRQLQYVLKVMVRQVVQTLPTGQELKGLVEVPQSHWCDFDFYSTSQSDLTDVSHPQFIAIGPLFLQLPADCVVRVGEGGNFKNYRITERYEVLKSRHYRLVPYNE